MEPSVYKQISEKKMIVDSVITQQHGVKEELKIIFDNLTTVVAD